MMLALRTVVYAATAVVLDRKYRRNARKSRQWTKKWLLKRKVFFFHVNILKELRFHPKDWHNFLRMIESTYLTLLSMVTCIFLWSVIIIFQFYFPYAIFLSEEFNKLEKKILLPISHANWCWRYHGVYVTPVFFDSGIFFKLSRILTSAFTYFCVRPS